MFISKFMTKDVVTLGRESDIVEAKKLMVRYQFEKSLRCSIIIAMHKSLQNKRFQWYDGDIQSISTLIQR